MSSGDNGATYLEFITDELNGEMARRAAMEDRGRFLMTAAMTLTAAGSGIGALSASIVPARWASLVAGGIAVAILLIVAGIGAFASRLQPYAVTSDGSIAGLIGAGWDDGVSQSRRSIAQVRANTLKSLRAGNDARARWIKRAQILLIGGLASLTIAFALRSTGL